MSDWILVGVIALILALAAGYVYRAKKQGRKCVGCPSGGSCSGCSGDCGK